MARIRKSLGLVGALLWFTVPVMAAERRPVPPETVERLRDRAFGASVQRSALGSELAEAMELDGGTSLDLRAEQPLPLGRGRSLRLRQTLNGVPIWGTDLVIQEDSEGQIIGVEGSAVYGIAGDLVGREPNPEVSTAGALAVAIERTEASRGEGLDFEYENQEATLVYYLDDDGSLVLSYHTTFYAFAVDGAGEVVQTRPVYLIDAGSREILLTYENLQEREVGTGQEVTDERAGTSGALARCRSWT